MEDAFAILERAHAVQSFFRELAEGLGMPCPVPVTPESAARIRRRAVELRSKNEGMRKEIACLKRSS